MHVGIREQENYDPDPNLEKNAHPGGSRFYVLKMYDNFFLLNKSPFSYIISS